MHQRLYHSNFYDIYRMLTRKKFKSNINRKWETFIIYKAHLRLDLGAIAQCFWCESRCAATTRRFMRIFWTFTYYCRTFAKINRLTSIVERQKLFGNFISRVMPTIGISFAVVSGQYLYCNGEKAEINERIKSCNFAVDQVFFLHFDSSTAKKKVLAIVNVANGIGTMCTNVNIGQLGAV